MCLLRFLRLFLTTDFVHIIKKIKKIMPCGGYVTNHGEQVTDPRHPANASQTNKKIYSPVHRFCDPITTTFGDFTGFQWRNCRSVSWGYNNSWPVNYRSDPGRFSGGRVCSFAGEIVETL